MLYPRRSPADFPRCSGRFEHNGLHSQRALIEPKVAHKRAGQAGDNTLGVCNPKKSLSHFADHFW
jgi:hypothetical protein